MFTNKQVVGTLAKMQWGEFTVGEIYITFTHMYIILAQKAKGFLSRKINFTHHVSNKQNSKGDFEDYEKFPLPLFADNLRGNETWNSKLVSSLVAPLYGK